MSTYLLLMLFISPFIIAIMAIKHNEKLSVKALAKQDKEEAHIDEEMVIHQALERAGALASHHAQEEQIAKEKRKLIALDYDKLFYIIGYTVIAIELWYIYKAIRG
ncbi:MAG: hypothetical protein KAU90_09690 [Sulfurovaceae bacterium]|nr:hypothetical protein [Sulfurovaceae bacterium]